MKLAFFYDQSEIVRGVGRKRLGSDPFRPYPPIIILYFFLKNWGTTLVATLVIPVTVLVTLLAMKIAGLTFNLMTLGGIAAAIGLVIDDAIVVVEAIHTKRTAGKGRLEAIRTGIGEILRPLVGSTLTPVVVFIPLAFLDGITGVFFRALALTMVVALLTSLALAVTLTPSLAAWLLRAKENEPVGRHGEHGGPLLQRVIGVYERGVRAALKRPWATMALCAGIIVLAILLFQKLQSEFLPPMDEGGFVIDYFTPPGTSLAETNRQLLRAEEILRTVPELASYSRRTGARLALSIAEPNTGDFLVKLKSHRRRKTEDVISELRQRFNTELPGLTWEFPGILGDLIGDLMWAPQPIEVKLFSTDQRWLEKKAPEVAAKLKKDPGRRGRVRRTHLHGADDQPPPAPARSAAARPDARSDVAAVANAAMLGETASSVLEGDRVVDIRVKVDPSRTSTGWRTCASCR